MNAPLAGTLVVAIEQAVAGPFASRLLADAGARVIKVERPGGDFARGYDEAARGISSYFAWLNRGKESIELDLKHDDDRDLLRRVISSADVVVQNLAVGALDRAGVSAESMRERDPRLIWCSISGYGEQGPYAQRKAYDLLVQAEAGLVSVSGPPGPLGRVGVSVVDIATGQAAALAISHALTRQSRDGKGADIKLSLFSTIAEWMTVPLLHYDYLGAAPERVGLAHPSIAPYGGFESSDHHTVVMSVQSDREWAALCRDVLRQPELASDARFATNAARVRNRLATDGAVRRCFARLTRLEIERRLDEARIAFGFANDMAGLSEHPQLRRVDVDHQLGSCRLPGPAALTDWERIGRVPALDEHGPSIREEFGR